MVLLAGGLGTRLSDENELAAKPMVDIGGRPILWHIMKHYSAYGYREFVVALGYKGDQIKRYFLDFATLGGTMSVSTRDGRVDRWSGAHEDWQVHLVETGTSTNTGGRVARLSDWLRSGTFMLTYGDGVSDIDLHGLVSFHREHGKLATVAAVRPPARFGALSFGESGAVRFEEKPQTGEGWINGGFMVMEPAVLDLIHDDDTSLELGVLEGLARVDQLMAYRHEGFWQCVDTPRDLRYLRSIWERGAAPWATTW